MRIYNSTVSELQHFVMQPLLLPILMAVNLHVLILKIFKMFRFLQIWSQIKYLFSSFILQQPLRMRIRLSYHANGVGVQEQGEINDFPPQLVQ